ncbi:MAG: DUF3800 domain-containing protein [Burkholderiales bacterium]
MGRGERRNRNEMTEEPVMKHSDYIIYVDESGDHSLDVINPRYPLFVLSFCIFRKTIYNDSVAPAIRRLKFATFGHDMVVLHETDIRKRTGAFARLSKIDREVFLNALTDIIDQAEFHLVATVIDKPKLDSDPERKGNAYHIALAMGLETIYRLLKSQAQETRLTYLICEARGNKEDVELELEFRRICDHANYAQRGIPFEIVIADKKNNSEGLQLADLTARPIGLSVLRPEQENRAFAVLEKKFYRDERGEKLGFGLKVYPSKSRRASE